MAIQRLFMNILTDDLNTSRDFFVQVNGMKVVFESDWFINLCSAKHAELELGLMKRQQKLVPSEAAKRPVGGILTFVVSDIGAAHEVARNNGIDVIEEPRDLFYGQRRMLVRSPSGMVVDVSARCDPDPKWANSIQQREDGSYVEPEG
jgi:predicted enzyme related to lactoylglutathione lyase